MASARKRGDSGERVLEGRHVIGLFVLMLLFSGVFFTLGYVMGRNQYDGSVRAASNPFSIFSPTSKSHAEPAKKEEKPKRAARNAAGNSSAVPEEPPKSDWEFYHAGESNKPSEHLTPAEPVSRSAPASKSAPASRAAAPAARAKSSASAPLIPGGAYVLQVAALRKESDALALAENLQKKKFPAFVLSPGADKFYRVQVGPYADQSSATIAKKGLGNAGFRAIVKH